MRGEKAPTLRRAGTADSVTLAALHALCFPQGWKAEEFADLLAQPGMWGHILFLQGEAAGFILLRSAADECEILTFCVAPTHRRGGWGKTLLAEAVTQARARQARTMFLEVAENNTAALALYRNGGFTDMGIRKNYYAEGENALTLQLTLG